MALTSGLLSAAASVALAVRGPVSALDLAGINVAAGVLVAFTVPLVGLLGLLFPDGRLTAPGIRVRRRTRLLAGT